jgi:hypothetical protein
LGVRIAVGDENERNEVIGSVLKLMNRRLEITAGKVFTVNNSLLFSASFQNHFSKKNVLCFVDVWISSFLFVRNVSAGHG